MLFLVVSYSFNSFKIQIISFGVFFLNKYEIWLDIRMNALVIIIEN